MKGNIVNFILSAPMEGRIAQTGSCCQIYHIDVPSGVSALGTQTLRRAEMVLRPSQKSRAACELQTGTERIHMRVAAP